jgi:hypothetical protein
MVFLQRAEVVPAGFYQLMPIEYMSSRHEILHILHVLKAFYGVIQVRLAFKS